MGNPILSDDGFGLLVAQRLAELPLPDGVEVLESELAGLRLLELVRGFDEVDHYRCPEERPHARRGRPLQRGGFRRRAPLRHRRTRSSLRTALELGRRLGYEMPEQVTVFAIEADDVETFGERLSPPVAAAAARVVELVRAEVEVPPPRTPERRRWLRRGRSSRSVE